MKYATILALGVIALLSLQPKSSDLLKQAEVTAEDELGVKCTAKAYSDCGGIKKVAMVSDDIKFTLTLLRDEYYTDNYKESLMRSELYNLLTEQLNELFPKHVLYIDVYSTNVVLYLLMDASEVDNVSVESVRSLINIIEPECVGYIPYIFITAVNSEELPVFEQLANNWYGIGEDTTTFYSKMAGRDIASLVLLDKGVTDKEIEDQLNTLY